MKKNKLIKSFRLLLLGVFLILITVQAYLHQVLGGEKAASIHALCPFGALESLYSFFNDGTYLQKIYSGTFILLLLTLIIALIFRRSFCGLICPFGALQEFFALIGKKIFKKRFIMNKTIDKPLRYLKYVILVITVVFAWITAGLWMSPYDPWSVYAHISEGFSSILTESPIGLLLLIITIIGSILYDRFFCKYLCPMGAFYGIIARFSGTKIVRNENKCVSCGICDKNCPVNIEVSKCKDVTSAECISCQSCVLSCPKEGALENKTFKKTISPLTIIIVVIIIFFGGILSSKAMGVYETTKGKIPEGTQISTEEIKGYMTIEDVAKYTNIELKEVYIKMNIPESVPKNTMLKEVKNFVPNFETEKAKELLK